MSSGLVRLAPSIVCICVLAFVPPASRAAESPFAAASEAFGRGDYRGAVALFEAARAGADGPSVPYNIAVCRYKLGEFATAEAEFADLGRRFPAMRAIAEYNRGLALLGLERPDDARAAFATARAEGDPKIVTLADQRLQELGPRATAGPNRRWQGLFELAAGDDDNVALVDDLTLPAGQSAASPFTRAARVCGALVRRPAARDARFQRLLGPLFRRFAVRPGFVARVGVIRARARSMALRFRAALRSQHARRRRIPERARRKSAYYSSACGCRLAFRRESPVQPTSGPSKRASPISRAQSGKRASRS
jgi:tetratricopeptide (TPR) repeat protein